MISYKPTRNDYITTMEENSLNSLKFENSSRYYTYQNTNVPFMDTTELGLRIYELPLLERYRNEIISNSTIMDFESIDQKKYQFNPYRLSNDLYGVIDYWYIILDINNYDDVYNFIGFTSLNIPDKDNIKKLIKTMEKNSDLGEII